MPEVDGLEAARRLRATGFMTPERLPIILLHSSIDDAAPRESYRRLGVNHSIQKPVKADELRH